MPDSGNSDKDPAAQVRRLLLSGDNMIKNRDGDERFARARERFTQALEIARTGDLDPSVVEIIERRLEALPAVEDAPQ